MNSITIRAGQRVSALHSIAPYLDPLGRAQMYKARVWSTMEYAPLVWMSASAVHLKKLDDVHCRAIHIIKAHPQELNIDPLPHRRTVAGLGLMFRLHTEEVPAFLKTVLPPSWIPSRFTRASASFGSYAVQCLTGKTESGLWSLVQSARNNTSVEQFTRCHCRSPNNIQAQGFLLKSTQYILKYNTVYL